MGLLLVAAHAVASLIAGHGLWSSWASVVAARGLSGCGPWEPEYRLSNCGLVVPWHMGSSQIRDRTLVSCIGRRILYHWVTREAPSLLLNPLLRRSWNSLEVGTGSSSSL